MKEDVSNVGRGERNRAISRRKEKKGEARQNRFQITHPMGGGKVGRAALSLKGKARRCSRNLLRKEKKAWRPRGGEKGETQRTCLDVNLYQGKEEREYFSGIEDGGKRETV